MLKYNTAYFTGGVHVFLTCAIPAERMAFYAVWECSCGKQFEHRENADIHVSATGRPTL